MNMIMKYTMECLMGLVENVCGPEEPKQVLNLKRVVMRSARKSSRPPLTGHSTQTLDELRIKEFCQGLTQEQKGQCAPDIRVNGSKKLLLLDLDKTIIHFTEKDGFTCRPHLRQLLKFAKQFYSVYIFTAATASYLEEMLSKMGEKNCGAEYFDGFLTRQHCVALSVNRQKIVYIKDIKILVNCDPAKVVVVDDTPLSYCLNP
jgi:hypothetical protein